MDWDIFAENVNKIIFAAIEHGGDAGGAYFSCPAKLEHEMEKMLYMTADFANYYKVDNIYEGIPQFVKL